ncbi:transketolase [Entomospira entomophila]|uniref:Transketolase n=1 Tax=Entomospira entomophila TaxID=2719988 RepID=A0A968GBN5_9SPIO|nr:transketolase [Entomospira entomophilus]NIZ39969.1 transketolase [Entomospira entomophilus]WDI35530.1 transketolase [Entomospira entomophilus]
MQERDAMRAIATSIRCLSMDMVQAAESGHPGLPLGMADVMAVLYGKYLKHDALDPQWSDRDRFILSAGHGSALLYSLLHLSGYDVSLTDLQQFRQINAKTAGHPEYGHTVGVETTTGPLGAGFATAVGMAIAEANLAKRFNSSSHTIVDHRTYVLMGDGCMMEGLSSEAASLAGHLKLGKLIAIYDDNNISIEGDTSLAFGEDVAKRFESYGWNVLKIDGHDFDAIDHALSQAQRQTDGDKPLLIVAKTIIAKGAPNKAGSHTVHGSPLGVTEIKAAREKLGVPIDQDFYIVPEAQSWMQKRQEELFQVHKHYQSMLLQWQREYPEVDRLWREIHTPDYTKIETILWSDLIDVDAKVATRVTSGKVLERIAKVCPALIGGSADLGPSNNTLVTTLDGSFSAGNRSARMLHFGVREHAMASISSGLQLHGGFRAFCATFMVFSDYMRPAIRLAAIMHQPVIYVLTHDSIYVGEDGPTHQPIEQIESMRMIPNLEVLRPADAEETIKAWQWALNQVDHPTILALSRQNLPMITTKSADWQRGFEKGGYIAYEPELPPQVVILATGSEVSMACNAAVRSPHPIRVVSVSSRRLLEQNTIHYHSLVAANLPVISVEAGVRGGWSTLAKDGAVSIESFGLSGKAQDVATALGMTEDGILSLVNTVLKK